MYCLTIADWPALNLQVFKEMLGNCVSIFVLGNFVFLFFEGPLLNCIMKYSGLKRRSDSNNNEVDGEQATELVNGKRKAE